MEHKIKNQKNQESPMAGEFLQSVEWKNFQASVGRKTFQIDSKNFSASIIEHKLPIAGGYFYIPKGPIIRKQEFLPTGKQAVNSEQELKKSLAELVELAKKENAGWIRIEPKDDQVLNLIKKNMVHKIVKAPHNVQPKEIFVINIAKSEEELLAEMKPKTRYNIRLAEKKEVRIKKQERKGEYVEEFLRLTAVMAKRQGIVAHPTEYYRKMLEVIPGDILKLYVAEYENNVVVANLVVFFEGTCTYLHGASDDNFRSVMAPYLLQWQQILDAKKAGCLRYDFGGVATRSKKQEVGSKINSWEGITRFKLGFSPKKAPIIFPGSCDIIVNPKKYWLYRILQKIKTAEKLSLFRTI